MDRPTAYPCNSVDRRTCAARLVPRSIQPWKSIINTGSVEVIDPIAIGVDGGGTHLRVAVATRQGEVLGIGKAGSGNYHNVGAEQFQANLELALSLAWEASQLPPRQADAVFLGLGGVTTDEDRATIRRIVSDVSLMPGNRIGVDHDLRIARDGWSRW